MIVLTGLVADERRAHGRRVAAGSPARVQAYSSRRAGALASPVLLLGGLDRMQPPSARPADVFQRPLGVTILVGLAAFRGVVGLWASIAVVGVLRSLGAGDVAALNLVWLAAAVLFLVLAYGAWSLKTWAWTLGVGLTAGSILLELFGMLTEGQPLVGTLISMAISAVILVLLFQPDAKAAFRRGASILTE